MAGETESASFYGLADTFASARVAAKRASQTEMVDHNKKRAAFEDMAHAGKENARHGKCSLGAPVAYGNPTFDAQPGAHCAAGEDVDAHAPGCESRGAKRRDEEDARAPAQRKTGRRPGSASPPSLTRAPASTSAWWRATPAADFDGTPEAAEDPCQVAELAAEICVHMRESEHKRRPSVCYMESVQAEINPLMRGILVDWLVEVAAEYRLCSDTLFLAVAYLDRYLSRVPTPRSRLQLAGVAAMLVASKYEEIYAPAVDDFCYITDNTYTRDQVLRAERELLVALDHDLTQPTAKVFLRRAVKAAAAGVHAEIRALTAGAAGGVALPAPLGRTFESLCGYLAELSLLEYGCLGFLPSQVAASCVLVALVVLRHTPWSATLEIATGYVPHNLRPCAEALLSLLREARDSSLPAVRDKYGNARLGSVAHIGVPEALPSALWE